LRNLDIRVVAEGIEAEVQASRFGMGCHLGQALHFPRLSTVER
jgi:EAL domain-containing protein (putative c-di-GMP-specific phosphodiesterase class I)